MTDDVPDSVGRQREATGGAERLGDLLEARRQRAFVGRADAVAAAERVLGPAPRNRCLFFHGAGGIGKTTLLQRIQARAVERGLATVNIDARLLAPEPAAVRETVEAVLHRDPAGPIVLLLDTCEYFGPILGWLFTDYVAGLEHRVRVIAAGREPPPGVEVVSVGELEPDEARAYLDGRGIAPGTAATILGSAGGNPLALAMACDLVEARGTVTATPAVPSRPFATELALRVLRDAGTLEQAHALRAASLTRTLPRGLLARMLPETDADGLFEWLARLSCIESAGDSLLMHDTPRSAIADELREQAPQLRESLCRRAEDYYREAVAGAYAASNIQAIMDVSFLSRDYGLMRAMFERIAHAGTYVDEARPGEARMVAGWIEHWQGTAQRRYFEHWYARQPNGLSVFRKAGGQPAGLAYVLSVEGLAAAELASDPFVNAYRRRINELGLPPGRSARLIRFWLDAEQHLEPSASQAHTLSLAVSVAAADPALAFNGMIEPDSISTRTMADLAGHELLALDPERVGSTPVVLVFHDWRTVSVLDWLIHTNRRARQYAGVS